MKKYRVTVNGTVYEVELEELTNAPAAPAAAPEEPAAPAEEPKPEEPADAAETPAAKTPDFDAPNVNPVELGHVEVSRTPDGKIDPTQIVDPAVAGDWEEQGCKG